MVRFLTVGVSLILIVFLISLLSFLASTFSFSSSLLSVVIFYLLAIIAFYTNLLALAYTSAYIIFFLSSITLLPITLFSDSCILRSSSFKRYSPVNNSNTSSLSSLNFLSFLLSYIYLSRILFLPFYSSSISYSSL